MGRKFAPARLVKPIQTSPPFPTPTPTIQTRPFATPPINAVPTSGVRFDFAKVIAAPAQPNLLQAKSSLGALGNQLAKVTEPQLVDPSVPIGGTTIQRKISITPDQISSFQASTAKKILGIGSVEKIRKALQDYQRKGNDPKSATIYVAAISKLSQKWLNQHPPKAASTDVRQRQVIEQLELEAATTLKELGVQRAQQQYVDDLSKNRLLGTGKEVKYGKSLKLEQAEKANQEELDETLAACKEYGLSTAELIGIRLFTADDYKYINPATASSSSWLRDNRGDHAYYQKKGEKPYMEAGRTHAGVMMQGFAKMPIWQGPTYRGARYTPEEFQQQFVAQKTIKLTSFSSSSTKRSVAEGFANGSSNKDRVVRVVCQLKVTNGRDLKQISAAKSENEVLLLAGAEFKIVAVKQVPITEEGWPEAQSSYVVTLEQSDKPPTGDVNYEFAEWDPSQSETETDAAGEAESGRTEGLNDQGEVDEGQDLRTESILDEGDEFEPGRT